MILSADKFGYYKVGDLKTYSKVEAIEWQAHTGKFPEWNFNKEIFDSVNWRTEPEIELWDLYKARAKQIRDTYDYCVLFYSGGSDSDNLLRAWIDADCKIDEIASFWNYEATKDLESFMCQEISRVVLPRIDQLKKQHDFVFNIIDVADLTIKFLQRHKFDYTYFTNHSHSPNNIVKSLFREEIKHWQDIINSGKKLCFVWGSEKPQINFDQNGHYIQFIDIMDNCVGPYSQLNYSQGWYDELFYWTPDLPELIVKQAHVVKRFTDTCDIEDFYIDKKTPFGYNNRLKKYLSDHSIKRVIYPRWDPETFVNGKGAVGLSTRDSWLWDSTLYEKQIMLDIISDTKNKVTEFWKQEGNGEGINKGHIQKHYFA